MDYRIPMRAYLVNYYKICVGRTKYDHLRNLGEETLRGTLAACVMHLCAKDDVRLINGHTTRRAFAGSYKRPLIDLLITFRSSQCSNDHDRIYALLGLALEGNDFPIDYDVPIHVVYTEVIRRCGLTEKAVEMIESEAQRIEGLNAQELRRAWQSGRAIR